MRHEWRRRQHTERLGALADDMRKRVDYIQPGHMSRLRREGKYQLDRKEQVEVFGKTPGKYTPRHTSHSIAQLPIRDYFLKRKVLGNFTDTILVVMIARVCH